MMRTIALALLIAAGLPGGAQAAGFDDPKALLAALYQPYTEHERPTDPEIYYSDGLKALVAKHQQASQVSGVGMPPKPMAASADDFDPFVSAKHYLLFDLAIGDPVIAGDNALVNVSYKNFDHPTQLSVSLLKGPDGWKIDDVASLGADQHWLLSWLLRDDPFGVY